MLSPGIPKQRESLDLRSRSRSGKQSLREAPQWTPSFICSARSGIGPSSGGYKHAGLRVRPDVQLSSLRDFAGKSERQAFVINDAEIEATDEFKRYMNSSPVWQSQDKVTKQEASPRLQTHHRSHSERGNR